VVVDLAVEDDGERGVAARERLAPARQVNDREAAHAQPGLPVEPRALVVRPAVADAAAHPFERVRPLRPREQVVGPDESDYSAHR
jgi:hypothetical protein